MIGTQKHKLVETCWGTGRGGVSQKVMAARFRNMRRIFANGPIYR